MDLEWDDRRARQYVANVGLITSNGPNGKNIMSAEWTHYLSYKPALMAVCVAPYHASHKNIEETKEFGLNLAADNQASLTSVAGGNSGTSVDKIKVLEELGFEFYEAKQINVEMVKYAAMNAECKVVQQISLGDHTMFVGEVVEIDADPEIKPLVYHNGQFRNLGGHVEKPPQETMDKITELVGKYKKST
ncbi:flavin reductase family protein [Patescibacteria group bacterium]